MPAVDTSQIKYLKPHDKETALINNLSIKISNIDTIIVQ